jgi:hypothetical protein
VHTVVGEHVVGALNPLLRLGASLITVKSAVPPPTSMTSTTSSCAIVTS